jgi:hypothetical protein
MVAGCPRQAAQKNARENAMTPELKVALISGGMHDALYARIPEFERAAGVGYGLLPRRASRVER